PVKASIKERLLGSTVVAGLAAVGMMASSTTVYAQSQNQSEEQAAASSQATTVEEVVVVGSRIRRDTYNAPSPVQVVTREETTLAGFNSTTEVLQGTGITGGTDQINNAYGG